MLLVKTLRFETLDMLRGLAALAVVIFHLGVQKFLPDWINVIAIYGEVGVQFFFVLSGFVIFSSAQKLLKEDSKKNAWIFLRKRFRRIYPPFLASFLLAVLINVLTKDGYVIHWSDQIFVLSLQYLYFKVEAPQVVYWSLVYELQFYLLVTALIYFHKQLRQILVYALLVLIAVLVTSGYLSNHFINSNLPSHLYEFMLGVGAYFIFFSRNAVEFRVSIFSAMALYLVGIIYGDYRIYAAIFAHLIVCGLIYFESSLAATKKIFYGKINFIIKKGIWPIKTLGQISYSLYLIHIPFFGLLMYIGSDVHMTISLRYLINLIGAILFSVPFYTLFEKPFLSAKNDKNTFRSKVE